MPTENFKTEVIDCPVVRGWGRKGETRKSGSEPIRDKFTTMKLSLGKKSNKIKCV